MIDPVTHRFDFQFERALPRELGPEEFVTVATAAYAAKLRQDLSQMETR
ncbi:hypothetical protein LT350_14370 [Mycolicibacterium smegmatis]|nr:hypothetical protein [Mycolicibacterium smegmatis]UGU34010.1 hypothetical protein LT350_14370 [Mycolicibacterium smegmatis]